MPKPYDITGLRFGRLIAIESVDGNRWRFLCDCGNETVAFRHNVKRGLTTSCGCFRREITSARTSTHGHTKNGQTTKTYACWSSMMERCYNPRNKQFKDWGGRGITVCERWLGLNGFSNFLADMGECPDGLTIDRIDNQKGYSADNCRYVSRKEQNRNKRTNKLTAEKAEMIRQDRRRGTVIAAEYGISRSLVSAIKAGKNWR